MTYVIGDQNDNYPYSSIVLVQTTFADGIQLERNWGHGRPQRRSHCRTHALGR